MIEKVEDFGFTNEQTPEETAAIVKEKLGIGFPEMAAHLSTHLGERADEVAQDFVTLIPYGDYDKLLEGDDKIANFLRTEAVKVESWVAYKIFADDTLKGYPEMIQITFRNQAVDEGGSLIGYVWVSYAGVVRHVSIVGEP